MKKLSYDLSRSIHPFILLFVSLLMVISVAALSQSKPAQSNSAAKSSGKQKSTDPKSKEAASSSGGSSATNDKKTGTADSTSSAEKQTGSKPADTAKPGDSSKPAGDGATGSTPAPDDASKKSAAKKNLDDLETALNAARKAIGDAKPSRTTAEALLRDLPAAPLDTLNADSLNALSLAAQKLADNGITTVSLKALEDSLKAAVATQKTLSAALKTFSDTQGDLDPQYKNHAESVVTDTNAVLLILKDIQDKLVGDDATTTTVRDRIRSLYGYALPLYKSVQSRLKGNALLDLANASDNAKADTLRAKLPGNIRIFYEAEQQRRPLNVNWGKLEKQLSDIFSTDVHTAGIKDTDTLRDDLEASAGTVRDKFSVWLTALKDETGGVSDKIKKANLEIRAATKQTPRDAAKIAEGPPLASEASEKLIALQTIQPEAETLLRFWRDNNSNVESALTNLALLKTAIGALATQAEALTDILAGDQDRFVQDQVRLFYFTDVSRLLQALRPGVDTIKTYTDDKIQSAQDMAEKVRADLLNQEGDILKLTQELSGLQDRVRTIQEDIRRTDAQLNDAANREEQAQRRVDALTRQKDILTARQTAQKTQIDALNSKSDAAQTDRRALVTQRDDLLTQLKTTTDPAMAADLNKQINDLNAKIALADAQNSEQNARLKALQAQKDRLDQNILDQGKALTDLGDARSKIADQRASLLKDQADLPDQLRSAREALIAKQAERAKSRYLQSRLSEDEAQAFGAARDNAPFFYALPLATSADPIKRVYLIGYEDSKTIYIRGLASDIDRVKDIIAGYDRPAPQARITLWTMQMSGSSNNRLNLALKNVDDSLRDLRGSILLIQDLLRDSINTVVNDVANKMITRFKSANAGRLVEQDRVRMARYFYYAPEIRVALGLPYDLNEQGAPVLPEFIHGIPDLPSASHFDASVFVTRWTLPDPAHATTLGEMLFVFSLGSSENREAILRAFAAQIANQYLTIRNKHSQDKSGQVGGMQRFILGFFEQLPPQKRDALLVDVQDRLTKLRQTPDAVSPDTKSLSDVQKQKLEAQKKKFQEQREKEVKDAIHQLKENTEHLTGNVESTYPHFPRAVLGSFFDEPESQSTDKGNIPPNGTTDGHQENVPIASTSRDNSRREMTANQLEILTALQAKGRESVSAEVRYLLRQLNALDESDRYKNTGTAYLLRQQYLPLVGYLSSKFYYNGDAASSAVQENDEDMSSLSQATRPVRTSVASDGAFLNNLAVNAGIFQLATASSWYDLGWRAVSSGNVPLNGVSGKEKLTEIDSRALNIAEIARQHNSLAQATPRVAAADDMIKRMIIVFEDDLDYFFVGPAVDSLRRSARTGVELGTLGRESVLATNRLVARVDPRATANLELAAGTDFLNEAQQLGQIANRFKETQRNQKLTSTLPILGSGIAGLAGANTGNAFAFGGLLSLFGDLLARPQEPGGEVYSINSGNLFKVTPIFDPSGQALRFKFDYSATVNVQEPNGTTMRDPSRIDRHTVNTEVQLTNLEFREISRFESNAKLGLPEQRTGGVPLLKELPVLRDIPLIGYYYRRKASAATRQESIIFAQTSLYPTVGDIADLLTDVTPRSDLDPEKPDYLRDKMEMGQDKSKSDPKATAMKKAAAALLDRLEFSSNSVFAGKSIVAIIHLKDVAPKGGLPLKVSSDMPLAANAISGKDPAYVTIPEGQKQLEVPIKTGKVMVTTPVVLSAAYADSPPINAAISVEPVPQDHIAVDALVVNPGALTAGQEVSATVTLTGDAPMEGAVVYLNSDNNGLVPVQSSVTIASKQTAIPFIVHTKASTQLKKDAKVILSATYGGVTKTVQITLHPLPPPGKKTPPTKKPGTKQRRPRRAAASGRQG